MIATRLALSLARFAWHARPSLTELVELTALCVLAVTRCESATGNLYLGQVRRRALTIASSR